MMFTASATLHAAALHLTKHNNKNFNMTATTTTSRRRRKIIGVRSLLHVWCRYLHKFDQYLQMMDLDMFCGEAHCAALAVQSNGGWRVQ